MDAKPQRPRALRIHDENAPMGHGVPTGKTLHARTKSVPAFSTLAHGGAVKGLAAAAAAAANKKVLGEANANTKVNRVAKDDSELGKASPGKIHLDNAAQQMPSAALARPAARPLASKSTNLNGVAATSSAAAPVNEVAGKKSSKVSDERSEDIPFNGNAPDVPQSSAVPTQQLSTVDSQPQQPAATAQQHTNAVPASTLAQPTNSLTIVTGHHPAQPNHTYGSQALASHAYAVTTGQNALVTAAQQFQIAQAVFGLDEPTETRILLPVHTSKVLKELHEAKLHVEATRSPEDVEDEAWDTSMVAEYSDEIFEYMREKEIVMAPNSDYMSRQAEIRWSMRGVLLDWVIQVHQRFNLLPETLFLTVNCIDRFLSTKVVSVNKLQLVGATALFIASKYEEVQCPTVGEIIYMVDGGYTADELLKAERFMLSMLQFELGWPGPMSFLRRISKADDYDLETRTLAKYFLEITLMDEHFVGVAPSFVAAASHCMARLMIYGSPWSLAHVHYSGYTLAQLQSPLEAMFEACEAPRQHHNAIYDKYTDKRYKRASIFVEGKMQSGFRLPFDEQASRLY